MATAQIEIIADVKKAVAALNTLEKRGRETSEALSSSFKVLAGLGATIASAFAIGKIGSFIETITTAAAESEDAINGLNTALALSGEFSVEASKGFQDFAANVQATTTISEEAVLSQVQLAKSFGLTNEQAKKTVQAAIQLSAATGTSLDAATTELANTFSGTLSKGLNKSQQGFNQLSKAALQAGGALDVALKAFGGSAEAQANTFSGAIKQLSRSFGEVEETLGGFITSSPIVVSAIRLLTDNFLKLNETLKQNNAGDALVKSFLQISISVIPAVMDGIGFLGKAFVGFISLVERSSLVLNKVITSFQILTGQLSKAEGQEFFKILQKNSDDTIKGYENIIKTIDDVSSVADGLSKSLGASGDSGESLRKSLEKTSEAARIAKEQGELLSKSTKEQADALKTILDENKKISLEISNQGQDAQTIAKNNLAAAIDLLDTKALELKTQGLITKEIEDAIALQKGLLTEKSKTDTAEKDNANTFISKDTIQQITNGFGKGAGDLASAAASALSPIAAFIQATEAVVGVVQKLIDFIPNILNAVANIFTSLANFGTTLANAFDNLLSGIGDFLANFLGNLLKGAASIVRGIFKFIFQDLFLALTQAFLELPKIVSEILRTLPDTLVSLFENLGPLVTNLILALADAMPRIAFALIDSLIIKGGLLRIAIALADALIIQLPIGLAKGFLGAIRNLGGLSLTRPDWLKLEKPDWLDKFLASFQVIVDVFRFIGDAFKSLIDIFTGIADSFKSAGSSFSIKSIGEGISGAGKAVGSVLGFAEGGMVPSGFPNDSFPARLTSGEFVADNSLTQRLNDFLDSGGSSGPVQIILKVGEQEMANVMYNLNRKGFRTT